MAGNLLITPAPHLRRPLHQGCATPAPSPPCATPAPPLRHPCSTLRHPCATPAPPLRLIWRLTLRLTLRHPRRFGAHPTLQKTANINRMRLPMGSSCAACVSAGCAIGVWSYERDCERRTTAECIKIKASSNLAQKLLQTRKRSSAWTQLGSNRAGTIRAGRLPTGEDPDAFAKERGVSDCGARGGGAGSGQMADTHTSNCWATLAHRAVETVRRAYE